MPVADVEVDHIDHKAVPQAIKQVAQRAANDQRVGDVIQLLRCLRAVHQHRQDHADTESDTRKEPALPATAVGKETERRTVVARVVQVKRREQRHRLPQSKVLKDQELAAQIDNQHHHNQPQPAQSC